ncbi:ABC transporter permease [Rhodobacter sp. KR11]|uniref:ABC transporter permease n=1 Tax=Rhodobacter sp. KR11 TaxID=2974588 RepID=UPI0022214B3E|nr:ABC transporter permease [Rhodobacter sp. KR11]MCW1918106.1 ABC transporter permease [Rhodobacter sp. KR11]
MTQPKNPPRIDWKRAFGLREMGVYYALILLVVSLAFLTAYLGKANYLSVQNLTNVLYQTSLTAMMAAAMTVILVTGNFDLSVASVAALSAAVMVGTAESLGVAGAFGAAMGVAILCGLLNGSIVMFLGINAFIVTLGTLTAIRGLVLIYTDGRSLQVSGAEAVAQLKALEGATFDVGPVMLLAGLVMLAVAGVSLLREKRLVPMQIGMTLGGLALAALSWANEMVFVLRAPVVITAVFVGLVWFVLTFTTVGRRVYAVGGNPEAARLSGVNVTAYRLGAFVLCSATAGFAGILFGARLRSMTPTALSGMELTVIASAILGGTSLFGGAGSVIKTVAGALLLFSLTNGFNILNLGANYQGLIEGIVVVAAAAIYTVGNGKARSKTS